MKLLSVFVLSVLVFTACKQQDTSQQTKYGIDFKGRTIDLQPYFEGFPYTDFNPCYDAGKVFYFNQGDAMKLMQTELNNSIDFSSGEQLSDVDFSKQNAWSIRYNSNDNCLYWSGDEANNEIMNIYRLELDSKVITKLTDQPYIYSYAWNKDKDIIAYTARLGVKEDRQGQLRLLNLKTGEDVAIIDDTPEFRFIWGSISFSPDGSKIVLPVVKNGQRGWANLALIDINSKKLSIITNHNIQRRGIDPFGKWLSDNEFVFSSNESGFNNLYKYSIDNKKITQFTNFETDISSYRMLDYDSKIMILAVVQNPIESHLYVIDPADGAIAHSETVDKSITIADADSNKAIITANSANTMFEMIELVWNNKDIDFTTIAAVPSEINQKVVHGRVERVEYPTFDIDPNTGKTRMIHGYLYYPNNPLPKGEELVLVHSFYGGSNSYSVRTQIMLNAGIHVFSPAPRGSNGFGAEFYSLNDKDLGGNEIIDIIYAGHYVSEKLNVPPARIGVFGGSHGGYSSMRLLSFPGEVNGNKAHFDWGFGISHAGFSDIIHFYENCNIPDWVILEAGDPVADREKLIDRSPLYSASAMSGKLLLLHGANDMRVPVEGSRFMADSLKKYDKPFKYVEFDGQGHIIKGLENQVRFYKAWLDFFSEI